MIGDAIEALGYERPRRRGQGYHRDPFEDQAAIRPDARVIVDGGANLGETAAHYLALFPGATVYSFEPTPESFAKLGRRADDDPRIVPLRMALADRAGSRKFFRNAADVTNSLLPPHADAGELVGDELIAPVSEIDVEATTLDDFCGERGLGAIDVLKLDLQGAELMALRGAAGLLARGAIGLVYAEILFAPSYEDQPCFGEIHDYLAGHDYALYHLYGLLPGANGLLVAGDGLWVSPAIRSAMRHR
jgi:FkbM family methyltransferase